MLRGTVQGLGRWRWSCAERGRWLDYGRVGRDKRPQSPFGGMDVKTPVYLTKEGPSGTSRRHQWGSGGDGGSRSDDAGDHHGRRVGLRDPEIEVRSNPLSTTHPPGHRSSCMSGPKFRTLRSPFETWRSTDSHPCSRSSDLSSSLRTPSTSR